MPFPIVIRCTYTKQQLRQSEREQKKQIKDHSFGHFGLSNYTYNAHDLSLQATKQKPSTPQ